MKYRIKNIYGQMQRDMELKHELENINEKLDGLDAKLDKNSKDGHRVTFAVIGFSISLAGIGVWIQTELWTSTGNFLILYGTAIMVAMACIQKPWFKKWVKIVFWVWLVVSILLAIAIVVSLLVN